MMECSELRIGAAAASEEGHAGLAASRVLESAHAWRDWGSSHSLLLESVAARRRTAQQLQAIRLMALSMIHRKAPFEYLRDHELRGLSRHRFFLSMFGSSDYVRAMVREHRSYLSAMCSYLCIDSFCGPASLQRIRSYERAYTYYWQAHVTLQLKGSGAVATAGHHAALVQYLRREVTQARERVLNAGTSLADQQTLDELRRNTGDTVRLLRPNLPSVPP
jgi:hypothetical protein